MMTETAPKPELVTTDPASLPVVEQDISYKTLQMLAKTPTVPDRYRESPTGAADMMAVILAGREVGVLPMQAIRSIYLANGRAAMMSELMNGLIRRAGHRIRLEIGDTEVTAYALRRDPTTGKLKEEGSWTFGDADAVLAGLHQKDTYQKYPKLMWAARAISACCRLFFPDVVLGLGYVPEEIGAADLVEPIPESVEVVVGDDVIDIEELDAG